MYLKNIEVQGFKSFAQKINFEFHNGITGIVGPNGSGKSNVGDAVRWVLGEQSAKQLRGGNMQDVIFSGTETRKPLSFASVAITLDNSDHKLPVEFNEVTVTRRLYRSGESEYLINGSACRLKDINEMFYDTGIGKEGYSIIGQGQIDKILSGKPEDRRELFDEAAGIVKYKRRKNTTIKKLEDEQQNLVRVTDILSELTKQLGPLERQSETARIYLAKRDSLRELDVNMFLLESRQTEKDLLVLREKNETASVQLEDTNREYQHTKVEYDRLEQELEELNRQMDELREKTQQNALQKQQLEGQINVLNEQIQAGLQSDTHFKNRLEIVEEDLKQRQQARSEVEEEKGSLHTIVKEAQKRLTDQEDRLHTVQEQISQCESAVEDGKNEIIEILNSRATTKGKAQRFDTLMEQVGIRKAEVNQHILHLKSEEAQQKTIRAKAQSEYDQITEEIHQIDQKSRQMDQQVHSLSEDLKKQTTQLEISQTAYHREASRLESLRNITERYDGYGNSIRRVMEQKDRVSGIRGVVADLIQVNKEYEIAIETALGGSIQNIVTDNEQTAKRMIEYLKKNRFGRATFLPLNSINTRGEFSQKDALKEAGVIGLASDLVTTEKEYTGLTRYLLGRVLVVDQIDHAIAIAKKYHHSLRMVTIEGESLSPGGSMTGGAFKNNSNLLGRRREIEELEGKVAAQKEEVSRLAASMEENRHNRNQLREQISQLQEQLRSKYVAQNTAKMNLVQLNDKEQEIRDGYERIRLDQEQIRRQISEIKQDHDKIDEELKASRQDEKELETYIETRQKELEEWKNEESSVQRKLEDLRLEASTTQQKESFATENLSRLISEIQGLVQEKQTILETLKQGNQEMENKRRSVEELKEAVSGFGGQEEADRQQLENWQKEKDLKNTSHKAFFEKRDHLSGQISLLDKECFRLKSQMEKLEESREAQISYMWEEYEITPNNALQYRKEEYTDLKEMKKQITQLKDEIRKLGSVNVNAIEDYKNLQERHAFLSGQYEDLKKAEAQLENIIRELDEGMRQQFSEKFRDIQREFDKAFKELFGGGKGTLELEEDVDILEAGIKIISQPPGKKLQNMMQLSGGEKALTAIALLFAIQNLKPSPFCLLDEIEAALDDSNVGRFAGYLQKLTKNTQFIIITHRRGTMNAADRLYGITMQEKGVSTLVSVDLVENQLTQ
ncbi:chromosome segregation protein SMC [Blautia ammoniilytica]|uniref:Chromosome partition protein Smc n=1 Tax=Blautia ammoniilytica TaxID=2981782 RepID=A0ABT2TS93_9FIRM|nr:chromosome segregation protein SMC [Blautia ammoniilytica]MCU6764279.1 chromosome segregation protein SMC [Blautia ammoniilytica]SCH25191.1 Chromosome partition protein Smc [uncultured Blautia sp.]